LIPIFSSYLRAFGHTSDTLTGNILANVFNVGLNALFLFVMDWGVLGVALATGISRLINLLWVWTASRRRIPSVPEGHTLDNREIFRKIIQVGLPAAMETSLHNLAITIVISLLNRMDGTGMHAAAPAYTVQISNFSYCAGAALAHANSILVGWRIGAGELSECDRQTRRNALVGIGLGVGTAGLFAIFSRPILTLFTRDPEMIRLVSILLTVDIFLEIGRAANLVFGFALKTSGDATYPMIIAVTFAFLFAAGGTWYFGIHLGWMAVGAYIAMALDECVRAVFMFRRWRKGCWKNKNLLNRV
jgi:Na+-driven multidrug efflux pump